jgi:hypothetical protein
MSIIEPIFLHSSWRTGGTALLQAFSGLAGVTTYMDPLNKSLIDVNTAINGDSSGWDSNHPKNLKYFASYIELYKNGSLPNYPNMQEFRFRNSEESFKSDLFLYLSNLIGYASKKGETSIIKFEQMEGHVSWLREKFPSAIQIGVIRDGNDQYLSWLEQTALGNESFFDSAKELIQGDPDFFKQNSEISLFSKQDLFQTYYNGIKRVRHELDFCVDIYRESLQEINEKIAQLQFKTTTSHTILQRGFANLSEIDERPNFEFKFKRLVDRTVLLTQQRDELTQQRDELTQQRDELTQQRDELTQQRDELTQQRDELTQQRDELTQQRDELAAKFDGAVAERDRITQALTAERDQIAADRDAANAQLEAVVNSRIWRFTKFYRESRLRRPKR